MTLVAFLHRLFATALYLTLSVALFSAAGAAEPVADTLTADDAPAPLSHQPDPPEQSLSLDPEPVLRIATYNIRHGVGIDGELNLERTAETIAALAADVILLTEVDNNWRRSGFVDQAGSLAMTLGMPYRAAARTLLRHNHNSPAGHQAGRYGIALLSRLPIVAIETIPLPTGMLLEPRVLLTADIRLRTGQLVRIYGTHLSPDQNARAKQIDVIQQLSLDHSGPRVLLGDLNAGIHAPEMRTLIDLPHDQQLWADPARGEAAPTFPADAPTRRIDYILVSPDLLPHVTRYETPLSPASDHLPVLAEIAF